MPRKAARPTGKPVPPLHLVMIVCAFGLVVLSGTAYAFVPADRATFFSGIALTMVGFLTGKLSNSFGKPFVDNGGGGREASGDDGDEADA